MNKYKNTINRILKVSMILGLVPISIMGATVRDMGDNLAVTGGAGRPSLSNRVWNIVKNALCCYPDPTQVEEPVSLHGPAKAQVPTVIMTEVEPTVIMAEVVPEEPKPLPLRTTLTNECETLIRNLDTDLNDYFTLEHLELTLPILREQAYNEVLQLAIMLAKVGCIKDFLQNQQANLSDSEINSFNKTYNDINSKYTKIIADKHSSTKAKAVPKEISSSTTDQGNVLYMRLKRACDTINYKIDQNLRNISIEDVIGDSENAADYYKNIAYRSLLNKLIEPNGVYSKDVIIEYHIEYSRLIKPVTIVRQSYRITACQLVTNETKVDQDIQSLYTACMLTYSKSTIE